MRKPICLEGDCIFFSREDEVCIIDDPGEHFYNCPCENGEFEKMYGMNGELWDG